VSNVSYFSEMFHNLGGLSIELDKALNIMVRSYRKEVSAIDKEDAQKTLLSFLWLLLEEDEKALELNTQKIRQVLEAFIAQQKIESEINSIHKKLESGKELLNKEISILDSLIGQISNQASKAFRRMRKAG